MTDDRDFKRRVRARMQATGERYTVARAHLLRHPPRPRRGPVLRPLARIAERARKLMRPVQPVPSEPRTYPFELFTEPARHVLRLAQEEADGSSYGNIATEHLLLGLIREPAGRGAQVLARIGTEMKEIQRETQVRLQRVPRPEGYEKFASAARTKRVLELALEAAGPAGHRHVGPEHLLLALLLQGDGIAARLLLERRVTVERVRAAIDELPADPETQDP